MCVLVMHTTSTAPSRSASSAISGVAIRPACITTSSVEERIPRTKGSHSPSGRGDGP